MKITDNRFGEPILFEDIANGQVFTDGERCYWIKFNGMIDGYNALTLDYGDPSHWDYTEKVYPVEAELIIK